jgi:DNA-binding MarR family transcriptional regulator
MTRRQDAVDPLKQVGLRRTHRALRVLDVIGNWTPAQPGPGSGPSNREIAELAGVRDEGHMSAILTRLEELGLIEVTGRGRHTPGEPYRWGLTAKGKEVQRAIEAERKG